ncbi:MAG: hypothetical protein HPY54_00515 [Chthonomonadetes bacterium]|nr:hypothetical protein [Chthonomonadetes bacterium]
MRSLTVIGLFVVAISSIFAGKATAQYFGYLPTQTGGAEQQSVEFRSNQWGEYVLYQRDMDTVLVGFPPQQMLVLDTTCYAWYDSTASIPRWWSQRFEGQDGTRRYLIGARARLVTQRERFRDIFYLENLRPNTDIYKDPWLQVIQTVYVVP